MFPECPGEFLVAFGTAEFVVHPAGIDNVIPVGASGDSLEIRR
jgi:hypothetical protein